MGMRRAFACGWAQYLLAAAARVFSAVLATPVCRPPLPDNPTGSYACFGSSSRAPGRYIRRWDTLEWFRARPELVQKTISQYIYITHVIVRVTGRNNIGLATCDVNQYHEQHYVLTLS